MLLLMPYMLAFIILLVIVGQAVAIVALYKRNDALSNRVELAAERSVDQARDQYREAVEMMRMARHESPDLMARVLDSLSSATASATGAVKDVLAESLRASFPPVQPGYAPEGPTPDNLTPFYAVEGAVDDTDPTDGYLGRDAYGTTDNLAYGDEPFGVPGLKIGADSEMPDVIGTPTVPSREAFDAVRDDG